MGNKVYTFTEEQLEDYQDSTYFTRKEILRIYQRFRDIGGSSVVPEILTPLEASSLRIPFSTLDKIPELKRPYFGSLYYSSSWPRAWQLIKRGDMLRRFPRDDVGLFRSSTSRFESSLRL